MPNFWTGISGVFCSSSRIRDLALGCRNFFSVRKPFCRCRRYSRRCRGYDCRCRGLLCRRRDSFFVVVGWLSCAGVVATGADVCGAGARVFFWAAEVFFSVVWQRGRGAKHMLRCHGCFAGCPHSRFRYRSLGLCGDGGEKGTCDLWGGLRGSGG